jgi:hypothetical protein
MSLRVGHRENTSWVEIFLFKRACHEVQKNIMLRSWGVGREIINVVIHGVVGTNATGFRFASH